MHYIEQKLMDGFHIDNRPLLEYRPIKIKEDQNRVWLSLGNTQVIAGLSISEEEPMEKGKANLIVNADFSPIAGKEYFQGPPTEQDLILARLIDRALRSSNAIALEKHVIDENKVKSFYIDVIVLEDDGNILDASMLAVVKLLEKANLLERKPLYISFYKYKNIIFVDPTKEEEQISNAKISIAIDGENIVSIQKDYGSFDENEIEELIDLAFDLYKKL
ncbi:NEQ111 [Nanoarchaeum equitans Kin4-M]|uniref:NEQ111 n=1 Tax=Nanoarchaeum equitans (strain Kin4-M) TaxID=228908 RepID=Q74ML0_NANEQ|nr:NEQ111 [Nanoarchaeum equitans Kin4-M]